MVLSVRTNDLSVWLGPADGSPVVHGNPAHFAPYLTPLSITRSLGYGGGDRLDHATFDYNLAATGERVFNLQTPMAGYARQLAVYWESPSGPVPIFWGDLTRQSVSVGRSEDVKVSAAVYPYHFGDPLEGMRYYNVSFGTGDVVREPIEFNPLVDGIVEPNMSSKLGPGGTHYWGDPESFRTNDAIVYQTASLSEWTLKDAVEAICQECNSSQTLIKNPIEFPSGLSQIKLRNVTFQAGQYLPYYLDGLLHPYGYDWGLLIANSGSTTERTIKIIQRGFGTAKQLKQQAPGQELNLVSVLPYTDTEDFTASTDVAASVNECQVIGGYKQYQGTFELYRGWSEDDDNLTASELSIGDPGSEYNENDKVDVWRLWIASEAADYSEMRTTVEPIPATPDDWSDMGVIVARRRRFEDCLTYAEDGFTRRQPYLEWSKDGGTEWEPVPPDWTYYILDTQCGIYFAGNTPPGDLIGAGEDARLRVTATITGDERLEYTANDTGNNSPNGRTNKIVLDMSDAFAFRAFVSTGDNQTELGGPGDTTDDTSLIQAFAEEVLSENVSAMVDGNYSLIGVRFDYELSDVLTAIVGRAVSLNRNAAGGSMARFPQVTGITWLPQAQRTRLMTTAYEVDWWYRRNTKERSRHGRDI